MVTSSELEGQVLSHDIAAADPKKPMALSVYNAGKEGDWKQYVETLEKTYPVVVFSKTYCPYSRKGKALLESYNLVPAPKIVEVDLREDGDLLKLLLHRLTGRGTFPNVVLHGKSIGGSDDLQSLHAQGLLKGTFEEGGVKVTGDVPDAWTSAS
jgi:glutaredoxin